MDIKLIAETDLKKIYNNPDMIKYSLVSPDTYLERKKLELSKEQKDNIIRWIQETINAHISEIIKETYKQAIEILLFNEWDPTDLQYETIQIEFKSLMGNMGIIFSLTDKCPYFPVYEGIFFLEDPDTDLNNIIIELQSPIQF